MNAKEPLVLCLTNTVAADLTANVLLALGAKPAMMEEPTEAAALAAVSDCVLVNVGTVNAAQAEVMRAALKVCREQRIPWVLDPVAVHLLEYRRALIKEFLAYEPAAIRGNQAEIEFLKSSALSVKCPVLATGEVDRLWRSGLNSEPALEIAGGVKLLQAVTATGCSQGAAVAAAIGRGQKPFDALEATSRLFKRAGENAALKSSLPGTFRAYFVDQLRLIPIF